MDNHTDHLAHNNVTFDLLIVVKPNLDIDSVKFRALDHCSSIKTCKKTYGYMAPIVSIYFHIAYSLLTIVSLYTTPIFQPFVIYIWRIRRL